MGGAVPALSALRARGGVLLLEDAGGVGATFLVALTRSGAARRVPVGSGPAGFTRASSRTTLAVLSAGASLAPTGTAAGHLSTGTALAVAGLLLGVTTTGITVVVK